jgi:hypothetical protein
MHSYWFSFARAPLGCALAVTLVWTFLVANRAAAQQPERTHMASAPALRALRLPPNVNLAIDGRLSEPSWAAAPAATRFTDTDPIDGASPSEETAVRIAYDDEAVYIGARMTTRQHRISTRLGGRDRWFNDSDWLTVTFDSYHDHQGGYQFRINPSGVMADQANGDGSWDPVWESATAVDDSGWTVEARIPFSQLRFSPAAVQTWGLQIERSLASTAEHMAFAYTPKDESGGPAHFGHLLGLENLAAGHRLELLPFVAARAEYKAPPTPAGVTFADPFRDGRDYFESFGGNLKYRPSSNFTLDLTVNPDFGQIEADESQVNLSANETFFGEKRPFFIEGANIFRPSTGGDLFYSRRIGRAPQGSVPAASRYSDVADNTTILGAGKLTGRTAAGLSVGVLEAITKREMAPWVDSLGRRYVAAIEPLTNYFVGRVKRDFNDGGSSVGGIVTQVTRDLRDSALAAELRSSATVVGVDARHEWDDRAWSARAQLVGSSVRGSQAAMLATQRSSLRYFQRPDRGLGVDSSLTAMQGWRLDARIDKNAGLHWFGNVSLNATSPGFETNDLAFQTQADQVNVNANLQYRENDVGTFWRYWQLEVRPNYGQNFGGNRTSTGVRFEAQGTLLNYWRGEIGTSRDFAHLDDRLTRGGPLAWRPSTWSVYGNFGSDNRAPYTINGDANYNDNPANGWFASGGLRFGFKPADSWSGEISPRFSRSRNAAQYIGSVADSLAVATYGRRYLFAPIDQTTLSLTTRLNVTLRPTLTLSAVAQPFLASGRYGLPEELTRPRSYEFTRYGRDAGEVAATSDGYVVDPDGAGPAAAFDVSDRSFNTRTVNGTAALRWDWRPGSTAYLVWQHRRSAPGTRGVFDFARDRAALFRARPENTLMVKLTYWVNP